MPNTNTGVTSRPCSPNTIRVIYDPQTQSVIRQGFSKEKSLGRDVLVPGSDKRSGGTDSSQ